LSTATIAGYEYSPSSSSRTHVYDHVTPLSFDKLTTSGVLGPQFSDMGLYTNAIVPSFNLTASIPLLLLGNDVLYYKVGENDNEWYTKYVVSYDKGESWTTPEELVPGDIGGRGPVKNKPIVLHDGT
jgi:hypothetical protein